MKTNLLTYAFLVVVAVVAALMLANAVQTVMEPLGRALSLLA